MFIKVFIVMDLKEQISRIKEVMEKDSNIKIIEQSFQKYKPEGVDTLLLKIEKSYGNYDYYVSPQYIIDKDDDFDLMKIIWKDKDFINYETKGDQVFNKFERYVMDFLKTYTGIKVYVRGRGVTEKTYWESMHGKLD